MNNNASPNATDVDVDLPVNDLGPLAWVLDELRKSLDSATKALRRFVRDAELARGSDLAAVDSSQLRISRQQLHQAVGALEMVGFSGPALLLRSMETAVQKFVQQPELCNEDAAGKIERASFALTGYLENVLSGKAQSAVALFVQYSEVQEIAGAQRIHPADLWSQPWSWAEIAAPAGQARAADASARAIFDKSGLQVIKSMDANAATQLVRVCSDLSLFAQASRQYSCFWRIAGGFFEAIAHGALQTDVQVKRAVSRILTQLAAHTKGDANVSDRLAQDLLFFCAQAGNQPLAPLLTSVRQAYALMSYVPIDYSKAAYGQFDPSLLVQARKRIASAKESWSALTAGDLTKFKLVTDQFSLIVDSLEKLLPDSEALSQALRMTVEGVVKSAQAPEPGLSMEVATAVLYLEAGFSDFDPADSTLSHRQHHLANRLENVRKGGQAQALEPWMEELYRKVSDRQTMGSVVGELKASLADLEKSMDQFFRDPQNKSSLSNVPSRLTQMRGVLSVLGLDLASHAVMRMRENIEKIMVDAQGVAQARADGSFERLGTNLGALGFLIDMLSYQPVLAKKLFIYDEATGELKPIMGRVKAPEVSVEIASVTDVSSRLSPLEMSELMGSMPTPFMPGVAPDIDDDDGAELLDIFLEEAREVVSNAQASLAVLKDEPSNVAELTTIRRAFHTLKGSSRMVGLNTFGEAAWAMEQMLNNWLSEQKHATPDLCKVSTEGFAGFALWVQAIAGHEDGVWDAAPFVASAQAMRMHEQYLPLALPMITVVPASSETSDISELTTLTVPVASMPTGLTLSTQGNTVEINSADLVFDIPLMNPAVELPALALSSSVELSDSQLGGTVVQEMEMSDLIAEDELAAFELALAQEAPAEDTSGQGTEQVEVDHIDFDAMPTQPAELVFGVPSDPVQSLDLGGLDFDFAEKPPTPEPAPVPSIPMVQSSHAGAGHFLPVVPLFPTAAEAPAFIGIDDQFKSIGPLRISLPLYNVYLNEADEWSRRLVTLLSEWALEIDQFVPNDAISFAHSLAGSSATVGFSALSGLARALENALQHAHLQAMEDLAIAHRHAAVFVEGAQEIRRLLHQFAAGLLKAPNEEVVHALERTLKFTEVDSGVHLNPDAQLPPPIEPEHVPEPITITEPVTEPESLAIPVITAVTSVSTSDSPHVTLITALAAAGTVVAGVEVMSTETAAPVSLQVTARSVMPAMFTSEQDEDEIDAVDALDPDLFPIFEEEALEILPQFGSALRQWTNRPNNVAAKAEVLRALHTLKGSARLAGALRMGELAHRMESSVELLSEHNDVGTAQLEPLMGQFDHLQMHFDRLRNPLAAPSMVNEASAVTQVALPVSPMVRLNPIASGTLTQPLRASSNQTVRVRSQLLDRLVNQAGEVMITRSRLESELNQLRGSLGDLTGNLDKLRQQLRDIEVQAETQMQSRMALAKETNLGFDPLEFDRFTRVQELTRMMAESVNDVATVQRNIQRTVEATEDDLIAQARQTRELQRDLLRTRMVEFEGISERLYRVVRQAGKDSGKQIRLDITGGSIEMDRGVLDRMTPAFEHLLRNCVAHGIEDVPARLAAGKEASGLITISLHHEGNDVSVQFSDDGAGLNLARIREKAFSQGLLTHDQELSDGDAASLIFTPGFTTANTVTELSGRGIGMDVVRSEINALGGRIETTTTPGQGTSFKLVLPLTTAVTQVVMLRIGSMAFGVPANLIEIVRRATPKELQAAYNTGLYDYAGENVPFFWSGALLQHSSASQETPGKTIPVLIFKSAAQRLAMHLDEVLGNQEVVVKNLGPQLARLPGLAGMTVLTSGAVALIYNPVALATVYGQQARVMSADKAEPHILEVGGAGAATDVMARDLSGDAPPVVPLMSAQRKAVVPTQVPMILVVDDSITVRRVTQRLLQREGYRVSLAADGLQALERLAEDLPTVILSDIEMPRMDGFDLARNIKADPRLADLPIIMITSRIAVKHREHAMALGVNHYLGKPYSEEELLSLIRRYTENEIAL